MPKILAIDTSTDACSAALLLDNEVIDRFMVVPKEHTNFILSIVDELLAEANLTLNHLDAVAFGGGPGSFTGARLAASLAQGFAFGADLPVIKISTLRTLAQQAFLEFGSSDIFVAEDARMQEVYWGEYRVDDADIMHPVRPDRLINPQDLDVASYFGFEGVGSGFEIYKEHFCDHGVNVLPIKYVQAKDMVRIAQHDFDKRAIMAPEEALPTYLREKVVKS